MVGSASPAEYKFGPAFSVDANLPNNLKPVNVNLTQLGRNIERDFPELSQAEWHRVMVHLSVELPKDIGGFAINVAFLRANLFNRSIARKQRYKAGLKKWSFSRLDKISADKDILVVLNPDLKIESGSNPFLSSYRKIDASSILAHELRHAVDFLVSRSHYENEEEIAHAYAIATEGSWQNSIEVGGLSSAGPTIDDWFDG